MKFLKILTRIGLVLLVLVTVLLAVRAVLNTTEGRKLSRALAGLKAGGTPLTLQELIAMCPDSENGAAIWKAAEDLISIEGQETKLINVVSQKFTRAEPIGADEWNALSQLIEKNRRVLALVPEIAGKPCFRYGALDVKSYERRIPGAVKMIRTMRLLGFEAYGAAEKGDVRASVDLLRTGFRFAPKIAEEATLITYLIAMADAKMCLLFLNRSVSGREAGEDVLLPLLGDLDDRQIGLWKALFKNGIRGERVLFLDVGYPPNPRVLQQAFGGKGWPARFYYWLIRPLVERDLARSLPMYAELETQAALPYYQTRDFWKPYKDRLEGLPWYAYVSKTVIPDMEATFMKIATLEAVILTARAGLACRIYKGRTGAYPESLAELVPALMPDVPVDPFTGKPLVYRRQGEGFVVYSLGSNQKDDGGRTTWEIKQLVTEKDDDWSWKEEK